MIVDANPIVSACLGHSRPLFQRLLAGGIDLHVPEHQMREAQLVTFREAPRNGLDPIEMFGWAGELLSIVPSTTYMIYEAEAKSRLRGAGPASENKDWPLVALALASGDDVWSNDVDLFGTGVAVWNTWNIRRSVEHASPVAAIGKGN